MLQLYCILMFIASFLADVSFAQYDGKSKFNASYFLSLFYYKVDVSDILTITWDANALKSRGVNSATCFAVQGIFDNSSPETAAENEKCIITSLFLDNAYNVSVLESGKSNQTVNLGEYHTCPIWDHLWSLRSRAESRNKIKLSWSPQSFSNHVFKPMILSCKKDGDSAPVFTETLGNTTTNVTVNNLEEDTAYLCTINTTIYFSNNNQSGECKKSYDFDPIKTKYVMRTPTFRSVEVLNDTSVEIEFDEPEEVDEDFKGFEISMKNSVEGDWTNVTQLKPEQHSYVVSGLTKGSTYYFRARSIVQPEGYSNYSEYSLPIELPSETTSGGLGLPSMYGCLLILSVIVMA
ncbi:unnamed protein product [Hymenolepis diminuta]|uniref:Fibronectin type-III domain-containing protein n=1 Tax=Hymenolepis diminuta TaxID=6216 RepID=A0A0R3SSQ3_HYMDI|nr:unnamed protein product [Hymenolepis diminuta]